MKKEELINLLKEGKVQFKENEFNDFRSDIAVCIEAININSFNFKYMDKKIFKERDFLIHSLKKIDVFPELENSLKKDEELQKIAINFNPSNFGLIKNPSKEVEDYAIKRSFSNLKYATLELKNNKDLILKGIDKYSDVFKSLDLLKDDKDVVLKAIEGSVNILMYASEKIKDDYEVMKMAIKKQGYAMEYASERLKNNKELVSIALKHNYSNMKFISEIQKNNKEIAYKAIEQNPLYLEYCHENFKNDKTLVFKAVYRNGYALKFVSKKFKNNKDLVNIAIKDTLNNFVYASNELKNDKEYVYFLIKNKSEKIFNYVGQDIKKWSEDNVDIFINKYEKIINHKNLLDKLENDLFLEENKTKMKNKI